MAQIRNLLTNKVLRAHLGSARAVGQYRRLHLLRRRKPLSTPKPTVPATVAAPVQRAEPRPTFIGRLKHLMRRTFGG